MKPLLPVSAAALLAGAIAALPAIAYADDVTVTGCAQAGVEAGCIVLSAAGKLYNITAAKPAPMVGTAGQVIGTVATDSASFCQQGTIVAPATWTPMPGISCPQPSAG